MTDQTKSNDFIERLTRLKEMTADDNVFLPSVEDMDVFVNVLDFIRKLSTSRTGSLKFTHDELIINLKHYLSNSKINDYNATRAEAFHQETRMVFDLDDDKNTAEDLLDCLESLTSWTEK